MTHGVHWLPMVDRIVVLNDGAISESGTYEELISRDGDFAKFLQQHIMEEEDDEDLEGTCRLNTVFHAELSFLFN